MYNVLKLLKEQSRIMNEKEIREIRRRFRPNKSNIVTIKGCIVDNEKNIRSYINQSMINTISDDCEKLFSVLKKVLSGTLGTNLIDLEYKATQVLDCEEHGLLMSLRDTSLKNNELLEIFYANIIKSVHIDGSYAILIASDNYDVFDYNNSGDREEDSSTVFSYIICAVCPIKHSASCLFFSDFDNSFRSVEEHMILSNPELGFMFPSFDDRAANIYKAEFYTKNIADIHPDFIKTIFNVDIPMPSPEKKETFEACLTQTLAEECNFNVMRAVHDQISEMIQEHKDSKQEEPLRLSKTTFGNVLETCGIDDQKVERFKEEFDERFGKNAELPPKSIIDTKTFEVATPYVSIKVDPERSDLISTQIINGSRYILIRANDGVEVNGITIDIK